MATQQNADGSVVRGGQDFVSEIRKSSHYPIILCDLILKVRRTPLLLRCQKTLSASSQGLSNGQRLPTRLHSFPGTVDCCPAGCACLARGNAQRSIGTGQCLTSQSLLQGGGIFFYLFCTWFSTNFIINFVAITVLMAADFWYTKNVTGRLLVGLRWWSEPSHDGNKSTWRFENLCLVQNVRLAFLLTPRLRSGPACRTLLSWLVYLHNHPLLIADQ